MLLTEVVFKKNSQSQALPVRHLDLFKWSIKHPEIISMNYSHVAIVTVMCDL